MLECFVTIVDSDLLTFSSAANGVPVLPGPAPISLRGPSAQAPSPIMPSGNMSNGIPNSIPSSIPNGKPVQPFTERPTTASTMQSSNMSTSIVTKDSKPAAPIDTRNVVRRKLTGYVGFANLPNQYHRKSLRKGFNFNVMVVGECSQCSAIKQY